MLSETRIWTGDGRGQSWSWEGTVRFPERHEADCTSGSGAVFDAIAVVDRHQAEPNAKQGVKGDRRAAAPVLAEHEPLKVPVYVSPAQAMVGAEPR